MSMFREFTLREWSAIALATVITLAPLAPYVVG
jgi:hypothetical protein